VPDSAVPPPPPSACRICAGPTSGFGTVYGRFSRHNYRLGRCPACGYVFVADPWLDMSEVYDERYYAGDGADPSVDYQYELSNPGSTVRRYEWEGIAAVVASLVDQFRSPVRWLDYGCGNGGLVRFLQERGLADALGFEEGSIAAQAKSMGIPLLNRSELDVREQSFDVVTAIEVLEHTSDPMAELCRMRRLLRPGGLLFLTTGNARPYINRISGWSYVVPEVHISFFEPRTLEIAMTRAGFHPDHPSLGPGFNDVLKFKLLKSLHVRRRSLLTDVIPAGLIGPVANRRTRLREHPIGWAR
jgi:SAM-dependent methyltransferase